MYKRYDRPVSTFKGLSYDTNSPSSPWKEYRSNIDNGWMWTWGNYRWQDPPPIANVGSKLNWAQFKQERWFDLTPNVYITRSNGGYPNQLRFQGTLAAKGVTLTKLQIVPDGSAWGASAYNRMKPTKPEFSSLNALYELRELPKMFEGEILRRGLQAIPDYWIALQFGWRPLLNDIVNLVKTQIFLEKRFKQLMRDNGKPVRRRIQMLSSSDTVVTQDWVKDYGAFDRSFVTQFHRTVPRRMQTKQTTDRVWASARFRYWLPADPGGVVYKRQVLAKLYGLYPGPQFVYNAIPWSWLADWFSNAGDIIENLDVGVAQRLAADYFYVMREREELYSSRATGTFILHERGRPSIVLNATTYDRNVTRSRVVGDPFGFATAQGDLSGMQLSILGALGMSRLK